MSYKDTHFMGKTTQHYDKMLRNALRNEKTTGFFETSGCCACTLD